MASGMCETALRRWYSGGITLDLGALAVVDEDETVHLDHDERVELRERRGSTARVERHEIDVGLREGILRLWVHLRRHLRVICSEA